MARLGLVVLLALLSCTGFAQPEYFGCHHFKNKARPKALTEAQRKALVVSNARSDTFDIVHYHVYLDVTQDEQDLLKAACTIDYSPKFADQASIILDLFELEVDSVTDASGQLAFNYDDELLQIYFDSPPAVEDTTSMTVYYHGEPHADPYWGGVYFELGYIYNLGIGLTTIPPNFGKVWHPCFDQFAERASYSYSVLSDGGKRAVCQGEFMGEEVMGMDSVLRHYTLDEQITTHVAAFAVNDYVTNEFEHSGEYGTYPVRLTRTPSQATSMDAAFGDIHETIDALEYWFGPYPYDAVGYVMTTDGALEIVTNIAYPTSMLGNTLVSNGRLSSHELGHHWWGDHVALTTHNDMWLKEGPAEYSAHLYVEWTYGHEAFISTVKSNQLFVLEEAPEQDQGYFPLSPMPDPQIYGRHTYYKGAAVLHNLRGYLGDDLFRLAMTEVQLNHGEENFTPQSFRDWLEDASGVELDDFFDDWALQPGWSTFVVDSVQTSAGAGAWNNTVFVQQKLRECPSYHSNVPISCSVLDADWEWHQFPVVVDGQYSTVEVETDFEPLLITLNQDTKLTQCWMDHEVRSYTDATLNTQLPYVDFRVIKNELSDSALVRVEHVWAGPDDWDLAENILHISGSHYWNVSGVWPEEYFLEGRVEYDGHDEWELDFDLTGTTEEDIMLVYRPDAASMWTEYNEYTVISGAPTNGSGTIKIDVLLPGQYAFANRDNTVDVAEPPATEEVGNTIVLFPNPAVRDFVNVRGAYQYRGDALIQVHDVKGALVLQREVSITQTESLETLDIAPLSPGLYHVHVLGADGQLLDGTAFEIFR